MAYLHLCQQSAGKVLACFPSENILCDHGVPGCPILCNSLSDNFQHVSQLQSNITDTRESPKDNKVQVLR